MKREIYQNQTKRPAGLKRTYIIHLGLRSVLFTCILSFWSCQKLIEIDLPKNQITSESLFSSTGNLQAAVAGMYNSIYTGSQATAGVNTYGLALSLLTGLLADEMSYNGTNFDAYKNNSLFSNDLTVSNIWSDSYVGIYNANVIIKGLPASDLPASIKDQGLGEAYFIRAFCHFYLVNLYGDVPLILDTDYQETQLAPRTSAALVYKQIIADLQQAVSILPTSYVGTNRTRVNKYAAQALLARVYLYNEDYALAESMANDVISSNTYSLPVDLTTVFLIPSTETIWSFDSTVTGFPYVGSQVVPNAGVKPNFIIQPSLSKAFEADDKRKTSWIAVSVGDDYPKKYKTKTKLNLENDVVLRLAEQYLIRAECRAQQNNLNGALEDINVIRLRAGLEKLELTSKSDILKAVEKERRVELFSEWGHRWLDLKRTNRANAIMGAEKPSFWESTDVLFPIPAAEILKNTSLSQNNGYD